MKNLLLLAAAFLISVSAFAQSTYTLSREAEEHCTKITRAMANELRLNELGYIKLKELNRERIALTEELVRTFSNNAEMLDQKLEELAMAYDEKVTAFLNPNQLQAYANYKEHQPSQARFVAAGKE
ncbi:hypothetical protein POKO110462_03010 [Pontibacter korlensis]|uniref:Uncharacterized protein n=1 Tax=Pontibacter korlensis TaxID=400092 RepID=A0A0E3ZEU7_9BACT|nr:hypothetical protein [Pontibacter korlensis]AKD03904.1 hypothetical protein PKOR_13285 [Pontibacter korlensis]